MSQENPFDRQVDEWFEPLITLAAIPSSLTNQIATLAGNVIPNRKRLEAMIPLLEQLPSEINGKLVTQAKLIMAGEYAHSFKFAYNKVSRRRGQCSATSEFFSLIKQAIVYNQYLDVP